MKILIAGSGKVGATLAEELSGEGYQLTLIDIDANVLAAVTDRYDVMAVQGNCASMKTLREAGVTEADLLIASTGSDELNLLCCVTAHKLNSKLHTIARIRNPEYAEQAYTMQDEFALSLVFNPEKQAATEIERLLKYPAFLKRDSFVKGRVEIVELKIDASSKLCGVTLPEIYGIVKCKVLVCAVLRDGVAITPRGRFKLLEGDRVFVTAPSDTLAELLKNLGVMTHRTRQVMIAGGGTVSFYLAQMLRQNHVEVRILEKDEARCRELAEKLPGTEVICGDATDKDILGSERLSSCDALITLTGVDELNIIISLYGHNLGVPKVITKIGRIEDTSMIDNLPIGSVVSPRKLCTSTVLRYVRAMRNQTGAAFTIHAIADDQAEAIEFPVDTDTQNCGVPLRKLKLKKNILFACITHGETVEIPSGDSIYEAGDRVVIVTGGNEVILNLNDIFE